MNKIYRIVFNAVTGRWVVASELATGRRKQGGSERLALGAVLVTGALGGLMGSAHAGVVVNGDPQETTASCELITDSGTTTWTASTSAGACLAPSLAGSASGQGNPGKNAVFYASSKTNGSEDSLNLGGYLDTWKTATFHGGIAMDGQKITGLADGTAATDAATFGQLASATKYLQVNSTLAAATAHWTNDIAIGGNASANSGIVNSNGGAISIGANANAFGGRTMAIGDGATISNPAYGNSTDMIAIGGGSVAGYGHTVALGGNASVNPAGDGSNGYGYAVGVGDSVNVSGTKSTAVGATSSITAQYATALGFASSATAGNSVALGANSVADRAGTVSVGKAGSERQVVNTAKGTADTDAVNVSQLKGVTTALGGSAAVNADGTIKAPSYALTNANTIAGTSGAATDVGSGFSTVDAALGKLNTFTTNINNGGGIKYFHANSGLADSQATGGGSIAIGGGAVATGSNDIAIGGNSNSYGSQNSVAIGAGAQSGGLYSFAMGYNTNALSQNSYAIGQSAAAKSNDAMAIGTQTSVDTNSSAAVVIGRLAKSTNAANGMAFGNQAMVTANDGVALGYNANASAVSSVALGAGSTTTATLTTAAYNPGAGTLSGTASTANGEVSIGSSTKERRLTNLAAGSAATDAVNVSQLQSQDATVDLMGANTASALGGGASYNATTGAISAPSYALTNANAINGTSDAATNVGAGFDKVDAALGAVNTAVKQNTNDIAGNTTSINTLQTTVNNISNGTVGLVQQAAAGENLTVGKDTDGAAVDFAGTAGARKLINVADGTVATGSKEAVNGGQLYGVSQSVATAMGGGSTVNSDGSISAPSYTVTNADGTTSTVTNAGDAISNLDGRVAQNTTDIAGNTTSINNLQTTVNNISKGTVGLVQQSAAGADLTVGKATDGAAVNFTDMSGKTRTLKGVAIGDVSSTSSEAVNGSQLYATNQAVAQNTMDIDALDTRMGTAEGNITTLDNRVTTNEGDISTIKTDVTKIDGRVTATETNINTLNTNFSTLDRRVTNVEGSVTNITNQLNSGEIGLVQYDDAAGLVTVAKDKAGTAVDFRGSAGARRLKGVAAGGEDEDAVNVSQLKKMADAIGGGATVNADGSITGPTYYVTNADGSKSSVTNMGEAITNLDGRVYNNTTQIQSISTQISSGTIGMVQQAGAGQKLTVGKDTDGTEVDFADNAGNARKLTNVADGTVEAGSKDAVNGGQLQAVSQSMASALGGGSVVNADGTVTTPTYTVTNADGSSSQVNGVEGAISNLDNRVYQNTTAITNNTTAINNLSTQISNGEVGLVKQDAATRQITVAKDSDGTSVSMAGTAGDRVVTGVAAAKADNDAVNLGQLKSAGVVGANGETKSVVTYDDDGKTSITMGGEGATTAVTIHNVADGVADHDAVNISQLNQRLTQNSTEVLVQANGYTDQKIDDVWNGMGQLARQVIKQDRSISQHGAMSMAEAQMTSNAAAAAVGNPNGAWSVGLGMEQGYGAISAGYAKPVGRKSQISFGAAFSGDERSVGMGFAHRL